MSIQEKLGPLAKQDLFPTCMNFYTEHPDLLYYGVIDTEVQACAVWEENGIYIYEAESGADCWTVYVRIKHTEPNFNPLIAIADFQTEEEAKRFEKLIRLLLKLN